MNKPNTDAPVKEEAETTVDPRVQAAHQAYRAQTPPRPTEEAPAEHAEAPTEDTTPEADAATEEAEIIAEAEATAQADETDALHHEIAELKSQLLRALADNDNLHKRAAREKEEASRYAIRKFAESVVNVSENLIRALHAVSPEAVETNADLKTLWDGIQMTASEMEKALQAHGITRLFPDAGIPFDHHQHQAISQIESPDHASGTIVQVVQAGYQMQDRLLLPAMVIVAK